MQELVLIGAVALIVFGPRKLPQMARTVGKVMAEFRKATSDFKETWEKEVDFEGVKKELDLKNITSTENTIAKNGSSELKQIAAPEIKEIRQEDFEKNFPLQAVETPAEIPAETAPAKVPSGKQDWI